MNAWQRPVCASKRKATGPLCLSATPPVKASSIDRNFGLSKLCKRLGDYEQGNYESEMKMPKPEAISDLALE
jgi:hypothetical protein